MRAAEHGRAAELLSCSDAPAETVAHHLLLAEPVGEAWAIRALRESARTAIKRGVPESASTYLRRALEESPEPIVRAELARALGNALVRQGDPEGLAMLQQALALAASPAARAQIVEASIDPLLGAGRAEEARSLLLGALSDAEGTDPETVLLFTARLAMVHALSGETGDGPIVALRALSSQLDATTSERRYAAGVLAFLEAVYDGTAAGVTELARRAIGTEENLRADAAAGRPLYLAAGRARAGGRARGGAARIRPGARHRARPRLADGAGRRALVARVDPRPRRQRGRGRERRPRRARDPLRHGPQQLAARRDGGDAPGRCCERGEPEEAQELLDGAPPTATGWGVASLRCVRAKALIMRHEHAEALEQLAAVEEQVEERRLAHRRSRVLAHARRDGAPRTRGRSNGRDRCPTRTSPTRSGSDPSSISGAGCACAA